MNDIPSVNSAPADKTQKVSPMAGKQNASPAVAPRPAQVERAPQTVATAAKNTQGAAPRPIAQPAHQAQQVQSAQIRGNAQVNHAAMPQATQQRNAAQQAHPPRVAQPGTAQRTPQAGTAPRVQQPGPVKEMPQQNVSPASPRVKQTPVAKPPAQGVGTQSVPPVGAQTTKSSQASFVPPVQKQYPVDNKIGTAATGVADVKQDVSEKISSIVQETTSSLNIPPSVAATMVSVGKAAEGMGLDDNIIEKFQIPEKYLKVKSVMLLLFGCLLLGILIGMFLFSSDDSSPKDQQFTIGYIVTNPEVPANRGRCGAVEQSRGCVLYIQNSQRRELDAKDFYPLVEQLSGLNRFQIETANMRYAHKSIKPGYIGQFNIPALK